MIVKGMIIHGGPCHAEYMMLEDDGALVQNRTAPPATNGSSLVAFCQGTDIGTKLVRRGWALARAHFSHGRYRADEPAGIRTKLYQARYC